MSALPDWLIRGAAHECGHREVARELGYELRGVFVDEEGGWSGFARPTDDDSHRAAFRELLLTVGGPLGEAAILGESAAPFELEVLIRFTEAEFGGVTDADAAARLLCELVGDEDDRAPAELTRALEEAERILARREASLRQAVSVEIARVRMAA